MRRAVLALVCAALVAALPAPARAQTDGQLAVVVGDELVAVNPDGSARRSLYKPAGGGAISGPAWSPDGNRIAFSYQGRITVLDVATREAKEWSMPPAGARDVEPAWLTDGPPDALGFRRVKRDALGGETNELKRVTAGRSELPGSALDPGLDAFALSSSFVRYAFRLGTFLDWNGGPGLGISANAADTPAWSPDGHRLAYVELGEPLDPGLSVYDVEARTNEPVAPLPAAKPRWGPRGDRLVYLRNGAVMTVAATPDATPVAVPGLTGATAVDWQPCSSATTIGCESVLPPTCHPLTAQVTTSADTPVELPMPCTDPAGRALRLLVVGVEHGTVNGRVYTPNLGFAGQATVTYRVSNGAAQSDPVKVTVTVAPRPLPVVAPPDVTPAASTVAPFLSLREPPRLDRRRTVRLRFACDHACTVRLRLEGKVRVRGRKHPKKLRGKSLTKAVPTEGVRTLRLRLPSKPKGTLRSVYITGTVRGANHTLRKVKLPISLRR